MHLKDLGDRWFLEELIGLNTGVSFLSSLSYILTRSSKGEAREYMYIFIVQSFFFLFDTPYSYLRSSLQVNLFLSGVLRFWAIMFFSMLFCFIFVRVLFGFRWRGVAVSLQTLNKNDFCSHILLQCLMVCTGPLFLQTQWNSGSLVA